MSFRGAERDIGRSHIGEPGATGLPTDSLPLLDPGNPNAVRYGQDWEAFLANPRFVSVQSQLETIPVRQNEVLSEVTTLQAELNKLRTERKDARKILMEAHQRRGSVHFLERVRTLFSRGPDISVTEVKTQKRELNTQVKKLKGQVPQAKAGLQGKLDRLAEEKEALRERKEAMENEWAVNRDGYRVVRFAFEQRRNSPWERDQLFETFVRQDYLRSSYAVTNYPTDLRILRANFAQMVEEDLERQGVRKPKPRVEPAARQGPAITRQIDFRKPQPGEAQDSRKVSYTFLSGDRTVTVESPSQLAEAMLPIKGLQILRANDVLTKLSHISLMSDQDLERFDKATWAWGSFKGYYIVPLGKHWWIYYRRSNGEQSFGIQKIP